MFDVVLRSKNMDNQIDFRNIIQNQKLFLELYKKSMMNRSCKYSHRLKPSTSFTNILRHTDLIRS